MSVRDLRQLSEFPIQIDHLSFCCGLLHRDNRGPASSRIDAVVSAGWLEVTWNWHCQPSVATNGHIIE